MATTYTPRRGQACVSNLKLNDHIGLNPALRNLHKVWEAGDLTVIQGAGYPNPNRSHTRSIESTCLSRAVPISVFGVLPFQPFNLDPRRFAAAGFRVALRVAMPADIALTVGPLIEGRLTTTPTASMSASTYGTPMSRCPRRYS